MRRLLIRILVILVAVILLAGLIVQVVLLTEIPQNLVLQALEAQLHLRASTKSLSTGWLGQTTMRGVSFSLPLADHPLLTVERLDVRHSWLIPLLFGGDLRISRLEFHKPALRIVRASDGRWNVEQLSALLNAGKTGSSTQSAPALPTVDVIDGTLEVSDGIRKSTMDGLNFSGEADSPLTWKLALSIANRVKVTGRLVPSGMWEHEVTLNLSDVAPWIRPWVALPNDLSVQATWRGRLASGGIRGRLDARELHAGGWTASGGLDVAQQDDAIDLHPDKLRVTSTLRAIKSLAVLAGDIRYEKKVVRAQSMQISVYGGPAVISGYYDLGTSDGQLSAGWDRLALPGRILHGGNLTLKVRRPFPTELIAEGTLFSYATTPQGPWRATLNFGGQGDDGSDFSWHVNAPELVWNRRTPIRLDGLELVGTISRPTGSPPTIALTSAHLPGSSGTLGNGFCNLADRSWALKLAGNRWPLQVIQNVAIGFDLDARGDASLITLNHFTLTQAQTTLAVKGSYRFGIPKPVQATVSVTSPPSEDAAPDQQSIVHGAMRGAAEVEGTVMPLQLDISGQFSGRAVRVAGQEFGDVALRLGGEVNQDHARIETERLHALGGEWSLGVTYVFPDELLDADLKVGGLPLENIGAVADAKLVSGTAAGEWNAYVLSFPINARRIRLKGEGWIHDLHCKGLAADDVHFTTTMEDGALNVDPITLAHGSGTGTATLQWNIAQPRHLEGNVAISDWPLENATGWGLVKLNVPSIAVDLPAKPDATTPAAPLQMYADTIAAQIALWTSKEQIGDLGLTADINGQVVTLDDLHGSLLGAPIEGSAQYDLAQPLESRGNLSFDHLDAARIVKLFPETQGLSGILHGTASLGPATADHPLEPLGLHLQTIFDHGNFRGLPIGVFNLNAFTNADRVVLDDRPRHESTLEMAGGNVRLWGRFGRPAKDVFSSQVDLELSKLNLDQIIRAANPKSKPTPGQISGNIILLYNSRADAPAVPIPSPTTTRTVSPAVRKFVQTMYGEAKLNIAQSDIATVPIFTSLYDLMSLGSAGSGPIGYGSLDARLENGTLYISNVKYFNRGTDAVVQLTGPQMWDFPDSPVYGTAVGSLRPLAALKLPLVSDIQSALDTIAGNFRELRIGGTWRKVTTTPIAFVEIGNEMRKLLIGSINNTNATPEGQ
jgi:hypothetical protein